MDRTMTKVTQPDERMLSRGQGCLGGGELSVTGSMQAVAGQTPVRNRAKGLLYLLEAATDCLNVHSHPVAPPCPSLGVVYL